MTRFIIGAGISVLGGAAGLLTQQFVAAAVYGVIAYPFGTSLRVSWLDYVEEYLLWRIREPTHGLTQTQIVANAIALLIVVVGALLTYEVVFR